MESNSEGHPIGSEGGRIFAHAEIIDHVRPLLSVQDGWVWEGTPLHPREYKKIRDRWIIETWNISRMYMIIWKQKVSLKVQIFGWLLSWRRLMTWVFRKKLFPDASAEHVMCTVGEEGCFHLFFGCQLA